jgi:hypothetical protein
MMEPICRRREDEERKVEEGAENEMRENWEEGERKESSEVHRTNSIESPD